MIVCKAINRIETAVTCPELQNLPKYSTALAWHTLMKNIARAILVLISILVLVFGYVFFVPFRSGYVGKVAVSVRAYHTNALGQTQAMLVVTNPGPHPLLVATGIEVRLAGKWEDPSLTSHHSNLTLIGEDPTLWPNTERVILITAPENNAPWRSFAMCQLTFTPDWTGQLAFLIQTHLFKRLIAERFYSPELSPPHHVHN